MRGGCKKWINEGKDGKVHLRTMIFFSKPTYEWGNGYALLR